MNTKNIKIESEFYFINLIFFFSKKQLAQIFHLRENKKIEQILSHLFTKNFTLFKFFNRFHIEKEYWKLIQTSLWTYTIPRRCSFYIVRRKLLKSFNLTSSRCWRNFVYKYNIYISINRYNAFLQKNLKHYLYC